MFAVDLIILCVGSVLLEYIILGRKYVLFSPFTNFNIMFFVIYLVPPVLYSINPSTSYMSSLDYSNIISGYNYVRFFYYFWFLFSLIYFIFLRGKKLFIVKGLAALNHSSFLILWVVLTVIYAFSMAAPLGFNPQLVLARLINPRAFTYIRAGYGPLNYLLESTKLVMLILAMTMYMTMNNLASKVSLVFAIIMNILGGSKTSFVNFLFVGTAIKYKSNYHFQRVRLSKLLVFCVAGFLLLTASFVFFYSPGVRTTVDEALFNMISYQKEAYYTLRVIQDFSWDINYTGEGLIDTLTPFIPRFVWPDKPLSGFYHRYWRSMYEPNTVIYHTSTFGSLAEAYMMFGSAGPILYAMAFFLICKITYERFLKAQSLLDIFIVCYIQCHIYFFVRFGLFSSTLVSFVFQVLIAYFLVEFLVLLLNQNGRNPKRMLVGKNI